MQFEIWVHTTRKVGTKTDNGTIYEQRVDERIWKNAGTDREAAHRECDRLGRLYARYPGQFVVHARPEEGATEMPQDAVLEVGEGTR